MAKDFSNLSSQEIQRKYRKRYSDLKYEIKKLYHSAGLDISETKIEKLLPKKVEKPTRKALERLYKKTPTQLVEKGVTYIRENIAQEKKKERQKQREREQSKENRKRQTSNDVINYDYIPSYTIAIEMFKQTISSFPKFCEPILSEHLTNWLNEYGEEETGNAIAKAMDAGLIAAIPEIAYDEKELNTLASEMLDYFEYSDEDSADFMDSLDYYSEEYL